MLRVYVYVGGVHAYEYAHKKSPDINCITSEAYVRLEAEAVVQAVSNAPEDRSSKRRIATTTFHDKLMWFRYRPFHALFEASEFLQDFSEGAYLALHQEEDRNRYNRWNNRRQWIKLHRNLYDRRWIFILHRTGRLATRNAEY